jgi:hypothetical protein
VTIVCPPSTIWYARDRHQVVPGPCGSSPG